VTPDEALRVQLWTQAQAQSKANSDRTTAVFNQVQTSLPNGVHTNQGSAGGQLSPNGSPVWSGAIGPGTFESNGQPPTTP
jgi:hypothetical protein